MTHRIVWGLMLVGSLVAGWLPQSAQAGGVVGTGTAASCTEAALDAALAGGGLVTFNCGGSPFTITVTKTKTIAADTSIDGSGLITLSGGNRVQIIAVNDGVALSLNRTAFTRGYASESSYGGGAIANLGAVTVNDSSFSHNTSEVAAGGAIVNFGTLTVTNSAFSRNSSQGDGGAIANDGTLTVANSIFSRNDSNTSVDFCVSDGGGAIYNLGTLTVTASSFFHNATGVGGTRECFSGGGAISNHGALTVTKSTFSRNVCRGWQGGGAILSYGSIDVTNTTFSYNGLIFDGGEDTGGGAISIYPGGVNAVVSSTFSNNYVRGRGNIGGGAILVDETDVVITDSTFSYNSTANGTAGGAIAINSGMVTVTSSSFVRNRVSGRRDSDFHYVWSNGGGAIFNNYTLTVTNSSFWSNTVSDAGTGGAIFIEYGGLTATNSTFYRNGVSRSGEGGAIAIDPNGSVTLQNSIVASSTGGENCAGGTITDGGHNLRWPTRDTSCVGYFGNPKLARPANNGGPTKTMALQLGSAAINSGDNAICAAAPVSSLDQRGFVRPGVGMTNCSIGAYEYNATSP